MRSHISVHRATTKYFSNSFIFKTRLKRKDFQEIAPLAWAQEAPGSNPGAPTTNLLNYLRLFLRGISATSNLGTFGNNWSASMTLVHKPRS